MSRNGESLPSIAGVAAAGEKAGAKDFDGKTEMVVFPGDLPADPEAMFEGRRIRCGTRAGDLICASCVSARRILK